MTYLKKLVCATALAAAASLAATSAGAADVTLRIGHLNPESPFESHSGAMTSVFKSLVETASGGEIEVLLFPNGQLGKDNEVIQQVRDGIVESSISSAGGVAQHYPLVGVFDIPFAFPNIAVANRVIDKDSAFGKKFIADLEAKIAEVRTRAAAREAKQNPDVKPFLAALKAIDKAIGTVEDSDTKKALKAAREPLA